jgi:hypothetical protein
MPQTAPHFVLERFLQCNSCQPGEAVLERGGLMDSKLAILALLIGTILALANFNEGSVARLRRAFAIRRWRKFVPGWRKS